jgi:hypothetical protein
MVLCDAQTGVLQVQVVWDEQLSGQGQKSRVVFLCLTSNLEATLVPKCDRHVPALMIFQSIIARSRDALVETFNTLRRGVKKFGLIINKGKTKYVRNTRK